MTRTCLGEIQNGLMVGSRHKLWFADMEPQTYHFPAKCSVIIAINRSRLPKIARWIMTGRAAASSAERYFRLNLSGNWKSSCIVAHWNDRRRASWIVMSIFGPQNAPSPGLRSHCPGQLASSACLSCCEEDRQHKNGRFKTSIRTSSAWFHVSIEPRQFSGRVDNSSLNWNPKRPYMCFMKSNRAAISSVI